MRKVTYFHKKINSKEQKVSNRRKSKHYTPKQSEYRESSSSESNSEDWGDLVDDVYENKHSRNESSPSQHQHQHQHQDRDRDQDHFRPKFHRQTPIVPASNNFQNSSNQKQSSFHKQITVDSVNEKKSYSDSLVDNILNQHLNNYGEQSNKPSVNHIEHTERVDHREHRSEPSESNNHPTLTKEELIRQKMKELKELGVTTESLLEKYNNRNKLII
jgi:hypothetical protein